MYKDFLGIQEIELLIEEYFNKQDLNNKPYTIQGLALALNTTMKTLIEWETNSNSIKSIAPEDKIRLSETIKKAKLRVENYNAECLVTNKQVSGIIFSLKHNFKWKDTIDINTTSDSKVNVSGLSKEELKELIYGNDNQ